MRRSLYGIPGARPRKPSRPPFGRILFFLLLACLLGSVLGSRR